MFDEGYMLLADAELDRALSKLRATRFEFVLLDIDGAGAGGQKFVETLRADSQLEGLPVLVTSRSDDMDAIERFRPHALRVAEGERHRRCRHPGALGDITDSGHRSNRFYSCGGVRPWFR